MGQPARLARPARPPGWPLRAGTADLTGSGDAATAAIRATEHAATNAATHAATNAAMQAAFQASAAAASAASATGIPM